MCYLHYWQQQNHHQHLYMLAVNTRKHKVLQLLKTVLCSHLMQVHHINSQPSYCLHNVPLPLISKQEPGGPDGENGVGNIPVQALHCADGLQSSVSTQRTFGCC